MKKRIIIYLFVGIWFGFVMVKAEAVSWYRIQEMFHFQHFHMFGLLFSAIITGLISIQILKRIAAMQTMEGEKIEIPCKPPGRTSYIIGGLLFGLGWGCIGLCPGPVFAMIGTGSLGALAVLVGALHGTWIYGVLKHALPH